jgi:thiol-disulfide isomerase/thioredoxin
MFFSYEDNPNINIVSVYITPENVNKYLNNKKIKVIKDDKGFAYFLSIWCPFCDRIQDGSFYIPEWKVIKHERNTNNNDRLIGR